MALKNLGAIRNECLNWLGMTQIDDTTGPSLTLFNTFINDATREVMSAYNFRQLETSLRTPFNHTITNVQGAFLSGTNVGGTGVTASIVPYPSDNLLVNQQVIDQNNYSGVTFTGTAIGGGSSVAISTTGNTIYGSVKTLGYGYALPSNIDQIYSITIPKRSIKMLYIPQYDLDRLLPNNILTASGTPAYYTEFNGLGPDNTKMIEFFPQPDSSLLNENFVVHYKKMHTDLVLDTDTQNVVPEQFQDIIIDATLERVYAYYKDEASQYHKARKEERIADMIVWANNHLDYTFVERDANFLGSTTTPYMTTILFRI